MNVQTQDNPIQQQLNYIKRKLNERTSLSNLANYANIAERISKGNINIEIDSVNKVITFGNGVDKICMNVNTQTLNNLKSIIFNNGTQIDGLVTSDSIDDAIETPSDYSNYAISATIFVNFMNTADEKYAAKVHTHVINDVTNLQSTLDGKANVNHNHDSSYASINHNHDSSYASINHNHDSSYASSSHTHSSADITNWSTATSNFAKLNVANTFTANQTITNKLTIDSSNGISSLNFTRTDGGDEARIQYNESTREDGGLEIATADDHNEPIYVRQYTWGDNNRWNSIARTATLLDANGDTSFPGTLNASALGSNLRQVIFEMVYPVGSIYMNYTNQSSPATILGFGTWVRIAGYYLYPAPDNEQLGSTFGAWEHQHEYGISYGTWYQSIMAYQGNELYMYNNGNWSEIPEQWYGVGSSHPDDWTSGWYNACSGTVSTGSNNAHPPSIRVAVWYRSA